MSASSPVSKIFAVSLQSIGAQLLGIGFFFILSARLSTADFGMLSWANAVGALCTTFISAGLEQVVLRRIAAGNATSAWAATAFLFHSIAGSALVLCFLLVLHAAVGDSHAGIAVLPLLFAVQSLALLILPLKLLLNARSVYMPYAIISFLCNAGRIMALYFCLRAGYKPNVPLAAWLMFFFTLFEFIATGIYITFSRYRLPLLVPQRGYKLLLRESLPQYFSVLFDVGLARADWIMLGLLSTDTQTGLYTFAYRAFELLRIPLVAVSLLLMPRIAPLMQREGSLTPKRLDSVQQFYRIEMCVSCGIALLVSLIWIPFAGALTHGRYGSSNAVEAWLLILNLPLHFCINLMWILTFSAKKYLHIARITLLSSLLNLGLNAVLIPLLGGKGAAIAFLAASALQTILYTSLLQKGGIYISARSLATCAAIAAFCFLGFQIIKWPLPYLTKTIFAFMAYLGITFLSRQWQRNDFLFLKRMLSL